jgi:hypothetical protein
MQAGPQEPEPSAGAGVEPFWRSSPEMLGGFCVLPWWHRLAWAVILPPGICGLLAYLWFLPGYATNQLGGPHPLAGAGVAGLLAALGLVTIAWAAGARHGGKPTTRVRTPRRTELAGLAGACGTGLAFFGLAPLLGLSLGRTGDPLAATGRTLLATATLVVSTLAAAATVARYVRHRNLSINPFGAPGFAIRAGTAYMMVILAATAVPLGQATPALGTAVHTTAAALRWIPITGWIAWGLTAPASGTPTDGWALLAGSFLLAALAACTALDRPGYHPHPKHT